MNINDRFIKNFNKFYNIQYSLNFEKELFEILKSIIPFESGYIFFTNPEKLEYAYNPKYKKLCEIDSPGLKETLMYKNTPFGEIIISGGDYTIQDAIVFRACASIIANITKDIEISKIMKIQTETLMNEYKDISKNNKKIKQEEEIKTKFLSHVSHELRTPINSILGFSDLLNNEFVGKLNKKQKEYINDIKISSLYLLDMINEILDMSKIETNTIKLNLTSFNIKKLITEIENLVEPLVIKKQIKLINNVNDFNITADYQKINQIIFNLLSNAIKFTDNNGQITISSHKSDLGFNISIKDNGIGIAKKDQKRIFKKFEQIDNTHTNSTGLGLAITKELVKLHKGKISLISELGKGSEFIINIPQK